MDIQTLIYFVDIAEQHSFSAAAESQNISQSSLSKAIMRLENELNVHLFDRKKHPIELTPAGECFYEDVKKMLPNYYHAIRRLKAFTSKCKVTVCVVPNDTRQNLPYAMQTFRDENPNIYVEFLTQRDFSIAERCLLNGEIDYLIAHDPLHEQEQIEKTFLQNDPLCIVLPKDHPLADREEVSIYDLDGMELLETYYGTMVAKNIEQLYHIHFKSIGCRPDIRRDMVLFSLQYESRAMLCYESDIAAFHIDGLKKFELKSVKPQPFVLMEVKGDKKPEFQRRMKSYLLTKVYK